MEFEKNWPVPCFGLNSDPQPHLVVYIPCNNSSRNFQMLTHRFFNVLENKRMIADFSQLHDRVHQRFRSTFALLPWKRK